MQVRMQSSTTMCDHLIAPKHALDKVTKEQGVSKFEARNA